jgi:hypothetical protein
VDVNSWYGVSMSTSDAITSVIISLLQTPIVAILYVKKATLLALTLIMAPFSLRKSVPKINSDDNFSMMWILTVLSLTEYQRC